MKTDEVYVYLVWSVERDGQSIHSIWATEEDAEATLQTINEYNRSSYVGKRILNGTTKKSFVT